MPHLDHPPTGPPALADFDERYQWMMSIAANIASTVKVRDVKVSPDGRRVLYQVRPFYEDTPPSTSPPVAKSELWFANLNDATPRNSQRLFEAGPFNDHSGVWHPDSKRIIFISDRLGVGGQLFIGDVEKGTQIAVLPALLKKGISSFVVEPREGRFVAFTTWEGVDKSERDVLSTISDSKVYGETTSLPRLGVVDIKSGAWVVASQALGPNAEECIESVSWSPDGQELLYRTRQHVKSEYAEHEGELKRITVVNDDGSLKKVFGFGTLVTTFSRSPPGKNLWLPSGHIGTIQNYVPSSVLGAKTLFLEMIPDHGGSGRKDTVKLYGAKEDAIRMVDASCIDGKNQRRSLVAVEVADGVNTRIDIVQVDDSPRVLATLWNAQSEYAIWFGAWDVQTVASTEDGSLAFVLAAVLTSGPRHEPPDTWVFRASLADIIAGRLPQGTPVSISHLPWLKELPAIRTEVVEWKANDGTVLDGLVRYPPGYRKEDGPKPTILHIHGGPYLRDIADYTVYFCNWRSFLAWAGYVIISPNFRGGQGHGHEFASAANKGVGGYDWIDCESMVDHFVSEGVADPDRLGVAGWSHGGSVTAWGVTQTKNKFKAAVVGAGATNWEGMVAESISPELEAAIGQRNPWDHSLTGSFRSSPNHHVAGVETAVLILHGEQDPEMPIGQAVGFYRGLKRKAAQRGKDTACLITYPREPHGLRERGHVQDVLMRVFDYFQRHLQ